MNSRKGVRDKTSKVEKQTNGAIILIFLWLIIFCVVSTVLQGFYDADPINVFPATWCMSDKSGGPMYTPSTLETHVTLQQSLPGVRLGRSWCGFGSHPTLALQFCRL